jgi:dipeptidase E
MIDSLMGVWRAHGLDEALRECWLRGIVLCGLSGICCWFSEAVSALSLPR